MNLLPLQNFIDGQHVNLEAMEQLLGQEMDRNRIIKFRAEELETKHWVWLPECYASKIVQVVYNHLNQKDRLNHNWTSWQLLWKLRVAPRVKLFLWKMLSGKLPTYAYLYSLNKGPHLECPFYNLTLETTEHIIWDCPKSRICWNLVQIYTGVSLDRINMISCGE